jgi:hypothetical protein
VRRPLDPAAVFLTALTLATAVFTGGLGWAFTHAWQPRSEGYVSVLLAAVILAADLTWLRGLRSPVRPLRRELIAAAAARTAPDVWVSRDAGLLLGVQRTTRLKVPTWFIWRIRRDFLAEFGQEAALRGPGEPAEVSGMYDVFALYPNSLRVHRQQAGLILSRDTAGQLSQREITLEQSRVAKWRAQRLRRSLGTLYAAPGELRVLLGQLTAAEPFHDERTE